VNKEWGIGGEMGDLTPARSLSSGIGILCLDESDHFPEPRTQAETRALCDWRVLAGIPVRDDESLELWGRIRLLGP
jgi:hypothetical protein